MLPPESAPAEQVSREVGIGAQTLERWLSDAVSRPAGARAWTGASRLDAVLTTAPMDELARNTWCREHGAYPKDLAAWRDHATQALADPQEARATPGQTREDRRRIRELERDLRRKEKALAEAAALLVLSKKVEAIFNKAEDE
jgi:transposase